MTDRLDPRTFQHLFAGLDIGGRVTGEHDCGPGRKLVVSRDQRGYSAWCYRCSAAGWAPGPREPLEARIKRLRVQAVADNALAVSVALPEPRVTDLQDWPTKAALWLLKAGLGASEIADLGAYYHQPSDRVVVPVLDPSTGLPVFWQARDYTGERLKYLSPEVGRGSVVPRYGHADEVVLTEDILSAFKVGRVAEGWSLMGTHLGPRPLLMLLERRCPVAVWLDPDGPGRAGASKAAATLRAAGIATRVIRSKRDPKNHTFDEIKELLYGS